MSGGWRPGNSCGRTGCVLRDRRPLSDVTRTDQRAPKPSVASPAPEPGVNISEAHTTYPGPRRWRTTFGQSKGCQALRHTSSGQPLEKARQESDDGSHDQGNLQKLQHAVTSE